MCISHGMSPAPRRDLSRPYTHIRLLYLGAEYDPIGKQRERQKPALTDIAYYIVRGIFRQKSIYRLMDLFCIFNQGLKRKTQLIRD